MIELLTMSMGIHFITSRPTLEKDINTLRSIISIIHGKDHYLTYDWIEPAYKRHVEKNLPTDNWDRIYKLNLEAIARADVVIAETTYENFAVGYQIATAIQQKKPILLLRQNAADKNAFVTGVEDGWVRHGEYDSDTLVPIIEKFLDDNDIKSKDMRFNFFIDRKIYNYLRWSSFKTGKTKAEIIRDLIERQIKEDS